jgi:NADH-quinone oxidoreductase subunit L
VLAVGAALLTTFYMTRVFVLTFCGKSRFDEKRIHVHESPKVMLIPLYVLAILSVFGGFIGIPNYDLNRIDLWLSPVIPRHIPSDEGLMVLLMVLTTALVGAVAFWTFKSYLKNPDAFKPLATKWSSLYKALTNKWYVDEFYESTLVKPIYKLAEMLWRILDVKVIDRVVLGFGKISEFTGQSLRILQTGSIQNYAVVLVFGVLVTVGYLIYGMV